MMLDELKGREGFFYLASPYSKYPSGIEGAYADVCLISGRVIERGVSVYSPIAHTHGIAYHAEIDPLDHAIWLPIDETLMNAAVGCIVAKMDGWEKSYGVSKEIEHFSAVGKPIFYLDIDTFEVSEAA
jgi:hypothetical protein